MLLSLNTREIWDHYEEKWPDRGSRFNVKTFQHGEKMVVYLPIPKEHRLKSEAEVQDWFEEGSSEARATMLVHSITLERERSNLHARIVRTVVRNVNASIHRGDIAAELRNPDEITF